MKIFPLLLIPLLTTTLRAADLPSGHGSPEGIACDAVMAYIHCDSKAWLETLIRPIYGPKGNKTYDDFKKDMAAKADQAKEDKSFKPPRLVKCFKARSLSMEGPASAAWALDSLKEDLFVDLVLETAPGETRPLRYHVLQDKDGKWYFEPRPDLCPLYSMGLNKESESTEVVYENP